MTFQVACLGAGFFAQFHHDAWYRIDEVELVGVADHVIEKHLNPAGLPLTICAKC